MSDSTERDVYYHEDYFFSQRMRKNRDWLERQRREKEDAENGEESTDHA